MSDLQKLRSESIIRKLKGEGLRFKEFSVATTGNYSRDDADWNYKDVPHLHHVHRLAEAYPLVIGQEVICNINLQSIMGIWFPMTLIIYEMEKYKQVYATTLLFFVLVVETKMEESEPLKTTVTTTYNVGYPRWLFFLVPLLKRMVIKNYHVLMEDDLPMRERRGALRKLGYRFIKDRETYGYLETVNIFTNHTLPPEGAMLEQKINYQDALNTVSESFIGDEGLLGLKLIRDGHRVTVWPRTCPHEGAALTHANCREGKVHCPWHGREFSAIGTFDWNATVAFGNKDYTIHAEGPMLTWRYQGAGAKAAVAAA